MIRAHDSKVNPIRVVMGSVNILVFILLVKLCGEDRPSGIAEWVLDRIGLLTSALQIERKSAPHHSTYRRILSDVIAMDEYEQVIAGYLTRKRHFGRQVVVAIDGKSMRGTICDERPGVHLLAAYLPEEGLVLMEMQVENHENGIPVAPKVLKSIDLRGKVVIGDAIHTQRKISMQIVASGGDYTCFAKSNQSQIEEDIWLWFEPDVQMIPGMGCPPKDFETVTTINKGHGRIENRLHYRRDVTLLEDQTRFILKNAAHAMACINNLILGILAKHQRFPFIPSARRFFDANLLEALSLIT